MPKAVYRMKVAIASDLRGSAAGDFHEGHGRRTSPGLAILDSAKWSSEQEDNSGGGQNRRSSSCLTDTFVSQTDVL
mgnify:FL=1